MIECNVDVEITDRDVKLRFPRGYETALSVLKGKLVSKKVHQVYVKLGYPRKPRTTGEGSQNHHLNGHISQIIQVSGDEFDDMKDIIKQRALKRGYPFRTDSMGNVRPQGERDCSTAECAMLIEEAHDVAAFLNIKLKEE